VRQANRRLLGLSTVISLTLHGGAAVLVLSLPWACMIESVGSDELDVDLVAPRLAPPIRLTGESGRGPGIGEGGVEGRAGRRGPGGASTTPGRPQQALSRAPDAPQAAAQDFQRELARVDEHVAAEALPGPPPRSAAEAVEAQAAEQGSAALAGQSTGIEPDETHGELPQKRQPERPPKQARAVVPAAVAVTALQRIFADREVKAAAPPVQEVAAVKAARAQREQLNRHAHKAQREREARAERWLADMNAAARQHRSAPTDGGEGAGGWGSGPGAGRRGEGGGAGRAPGYGLHFYLAGRPVKGDRVVRPPEAIELPRVQCRVARLDITPATVRMLVVKDGKVGIAYLKHSSSSREFDRCALGHARSIRFRPGHDGADVPLDVWINVRVEPSALSQLVEGK
jgi:hypothetical protein